ncbi:BnaC03g69800D [Brassica napus]|uniref:Uncharacterized protein n=2 Tax=Brassica TaxID=3705 RepID=A0A3P6BGA3_BRAOL|nr:unnamed protein product [Brassica napus]CDY25695.1 BnaC03g69800D [Brassica napus]VDD01336.1 unnamed protein product [Brassica oleracea]
MLRVALLLTTSTSSLSLESCGRFQELMEELYPRGYWLLFSTTSTSASIRVGLPGPPSSQLERTFEFDFGKSYLYGLLLDSISLPKMRKCVDEELNAEVCCNL